MMKRIVVLLLLIAGVSRASIPELVDQLGSTNLTEKTEAQARLLAVCSHAGRSGAEAERIEICKELCAMLETGVSIPEALLLVNNLQRIGGKESVPTLATLLKDSDRQVREAARQALAVNPASSAGKVLEKALKKSSDPRWTSGLIMALGERGQQGTSKNIHAYLKSKDLLVFTTTAKVLGQLNEPVGLKALARQRAKETGVRKEILTAALLSTGRPDVFKLLYSQKESDATRALALLGLVLHHGEDTLAETALESGQAGLQAAVIEAARQSGDSSLYSLLAGQLNTLPPHLQVQAMGVLEFSGDRGFAKVAVPFLTVEDAALQTAAAQMLSKVGTSDSVPHLLAVAEQSKEAKRALHRVGAPGVDEVLEKVSTAGEAEQRALAIEALAVRGRIQLIPQFFAYAADSDVDAAVAKAAVKAIAVMGSEGDLAQMADLMLAKEETPLAREALKAAVTMIRRFITPDDAVTVLVERIPDASVKGQVLLLKALAQISSEAALEPVVLALRSDDEILYKESLKLLGNWKNDLAVPVLLDVAGDEATEAADHLVAMKGIARQLSMQRELDEPTAIQAMGLCTGTEEKKLMIGVLAKSKSPEAIAAVQTCVEDPELKEDAEAALERMLPKQ